MSSTWSSRFASWIGNSYRLFAPSPTPQRYQSWTRQQLIDRLTALESPSTPQAVQHRKPFEMSDYAQHRIALKVAYVGWRYLGFAAQKDIDQTVEGELFRSLTSSRLIQDAESCNFTRCGRTDKGVSGFGQVVALDVRQSNSKLTSPNNTTLPYVDILNNLLPDDIRILAWSPVHASFNARFDCISRTYKYMFLRQDLDVGLMQDAALRLVGTHDFRHFCKLDPSKQVNYTRTILSIDIQPTHNDQYEVVIRGSAFLWHQVRCIMSVLFLVGQRLESPTVIDTLLNIDQLEAKPDYPLASDLPLVLWDCTYPEGVLDWRSSNRPERLQQHWDDTAYDHTVRAWLHQSFANNLQPSNNRNTTVVLGGGRSIRTTKYRPLLQRARADSDQVKRAKYHAKLERKRMERGANV